MSATIWYISKYISLPSSGKWGTRAFMLAREFVRRGHRCLMITSDSNHLTSVPEISGDRLVERIDGVEICWLRTRKYSGAKSLGRILSWLDFEYRLWRMPTRHLPRPDVIIVSSLSLLTILNGLRLQRKYRCRLIFEIRDIWPLTLVEEGGFSPKNPFVLLLGWIEKLGYRKADAIVGTMPNLVEHVDNVVASHGPVHTIPIGLDLSLLSEAEAVPEDWIAANIPQDKFIVCHAGTIGITNALDTFLACARRMKAHEDIHFLLVGEGDLRSGYEAQTEDLPNISFTGPVPKPMVQSVLKRTDLLYFSVHRSKVWRYGMSLNKAVDYMLAARPIVASYTGFRTMVEEAGAGTEVPAGDVEALEREILRYRAMDASERQKIGANGREWLIRHRPYEKLGQEYLDIALARQDAGPQHAH